MRSKAHKVKYTSHCGDDDNQRSSSHRTIEKLSTLLTVATMTTKRSSSHRTIEKLSTLLTVATTVTVAKSVTPVGAGKPDLAMLKIKNRVVELSRQIASVEGISELSKPGWKVLNLPVSRKRNDLLDLIEQVQNRMTGELVPQAKFDDNDILTMV